MKVTIVDSVSPIKNLKIPQLGPLTIYNVIKEEHDVTYISLSMLSVDKCSELSKRLEDNIPFYGKKILESTPDVVSFYCLCDSFISALLIAEYVKEKNGKIKIIFAGPHISHFHQQALCSFPFIDIVSYGEGELTSKDLFSALKHEYPLDRVNGIVFRSSDGKIICNPANRLISEEELCENILTDFEPYSVSTMDTIYLEAGRGCPYKCSFCCTSVFWGRKNRVKPAKSLVKEMRCLSNKYGINVFSLQHDLFTINRKNVEEFCEEIVNSDLDLRWYCSARVDCLDNELVKHMKTAGCEMIFLGIESGSQHVQKIINKNINVEKIVECIDMISASGIGVAASFIYGLPGETVEDFLQTSDLITALLRKDILAMNANAYIVLPGTVFLNKYRDSLVFLPQKLSTSLFRRCSFGEKALKYITSYPECFQSYYTFPSEVMDRYAHFDLVVAIFTQCRDVFRGVLRYFINNYSLHKIYERHRSSIDALYNGLNNYNQYGNSINENQLYYKCIKEMISKELMSGDICDSNLRSLLEISDFEERLSEATTMNKYKLLRYNMDVLCYRNTGIVNWKETVIEVYMVNGRVCYRSKHANADVFENRGNGLVRHS